MLSILVIGTLYFSYSYWKKKKKIFNIKKIATLTIFYSIYLIQAFISNEANFVWVSFDIMTIVVVGFLFGPLEGMIFGLICDWTGVLISGSQPMMYYAVQYPFFGMLAGTLGLLYSKYKNYISKTSSFIICQVAITSILITGFTVPLVVPIDDPIPWWQIITTTSLIFVAFESLIVYLFIAKKDKKDISMFTLLFSAYLISRIVGGIILKPIGDIYWWSTWESYSEKIALQLLKTTYLTPINTLLGFTLVKGSIFASLQISSPKDFGIII